MFNFANWCCVSVLFHFLLLSYPAKVQGLLCHCDPCQGGPATNTNETCVAGEGRKCFAAYTVSESGRERRFFGCTRTKYAVSKCTAAPDASSVMLCCDDADLCNLMLKPTLPPPPPPTEAEERPESRTVHIMRIVAIVSGPICVLYTLIMVVVCVTRIQRKRRDDELRRIYGFRPRDHELLPTSTELLRQQQAAAAAVAHESTNSNDSGIGDESRTPIYTPRLLDGDPASSPSHQLLLTHTAETHDL